MASKEATVFVVDLHQSMGRTMARGDSADMITDLEWGQQYIYSEISNKILSGRKTDVVGVVGFNTDTTQNMFDNEDDFQNIDILSPIQQFHLDTLLELKERIVPNGNNQSDLMSAIVVAIQMIKLHTKALKWIRNIIVLTNGMGTLKMDDEDGIIRQINENGITLKVMGIDFDDDEFGEYVEENKPEVKRENEAKLKEFSSRCENSVFATYKEARDSLDIPKVRSVNPVRAFQGDLVLSNPEQQPQHRVMAVNIEVFPCTRRATAMTASSYAMTKQDSETTANLQAVKWDRQYFVDDETAAGGKKDLEREDLENGYRYGSEIVYITKEEEEAILFQTTASLQIIGFVNKDTVPPYILMGHTDYVVGQRGDARAAVAISAFCRALFELENYCLARYVPKDGKDPQLVVLMPYFKPDLEVLISCTLPFAEDERKFVFPSLTQLQLKSGTKTVATHSRLLPTDEMLSAMDDYVDAMDLSKLNNEDGDPWLSIEDAFNPTIHHIKNTVKVCALMQDCDNIPQPLPVLKQYMYPPEELVEEAKPHLELLKHLLEIKEQFREVKKRKTEDVTAQTGLDLDALLDGGPQVKKEESSASLSVPDTSAAPSSQQPAAAMSQNSQAVSLDPENIVPDFVRALNKIDTKATSDEDFKANAIILYKETSTLLEEKVSSSSGNASYNEVISVLQTMKEQAEEMDIPDVFESTKAEFVKKLEGGDLGGQRNVLVGQIESL